MWRGKENDGERGLGFGGGATNTKDVVNDRWAEEQGKIKCPKGCLSSLHWKYDFKMPLQNIFKNSILNFAIFI